MILLIDCFLQCSPCCDVANGVREVLGRREQNANTGGNGGFRGACSFRIPGSLVEAADWNCSSSSKF